MRSLRKVILPIVLTLVVIGVPACDLLREAQGPTLQVLSPQNFAQVQLGESVDIVSTATDPKGVTRVELYVGEDLYLTYASPGPEGEKVWTFTQTWTPTAPGFYTLAVVAHNVEDVASTPWAVAVEVVEGRTTEGTPASTIPPATTTPPPGATGTPPPSTGTPSASTGTAAPPPPPTNTPQAWADLYIAEFSIDPEEPRVGEEAQSRIVVRNGGNAPSGSYGLSGPREPPGPGTQLMTPPECQPLAPGEERVFARPITFSEQGLATIWVGLSIRPQDPDSNEDNDTAELQVNVRPAVEQPMADLVISSLTLDPAQPRVGEEVQVSIGVRNQGDALSASYGFVISVTPRPPSLHPFAGQEGSLAPGEERDYGPLSFTFAEPGPATIRANVGTGPGEDSNEENNTAELVVNVLPGDLPDLYIGQVALNPSSPRVGQEVQVSVSLGNSGTGDAGPHVVIWRSDPDTIGCSWPVNSLAAGRTTGLTCPYTYTYPHSGQSTYTTADANGDVHESNEDNNVRYLRVNVRPAS